MSLYYRRNVSNIASANDLYSQGLFLQSYGVALSISSIQNPVPVFVFNPNTQVVDITGDLNVTGKITYTSITAYVNQTGMVNLADQNAIDVMDIGVNGQYNTTQFTGIIRQASDPLKRWTFFDGTTVPPTTIITGINSSTLASTRMNKIYINDGTVSSPSIIFDSDNLQNTGIYRVAENTIGFASGGANIVTIQPSGVNFTTGSTVNVGTSSNTSTLNVNGAFNNYGKSSFTGIGTTTPANSIMYIGSSGPTTITDPISYYFTYFDQPTITGSTTGLAATVYIAGEPNGIISQKYALYIGSGTTYVQQLISNGLLIANEGINVADGTVVNIGLVGASTPLNVYGNTNLKAGVINSVTIDNAASITLLSTHNIVEASFAGAVSVSLPDITANIGQNYTIVKTGATGAVTITTSFGQLIDNFTNSITLYNQYDRVTLVGGSIQWYTI